MDVGSISSNALGSLLGGLALILLIHISRKVYARITQHEKHPRELLSEAVRNTPEYDHILQNRETYRIWGYMALFALLAIVANFIAIFVFMKTISGDVSFIILPVLLLILIPLTFYLAVCRRETGTAHLSWYTSSLSERTE